MDIREENAEYEVYRNFWQSNLQQIEHIHAGLRIYLAQLEDKYTDFDALYEKLMDRIDLLSSVYASYNSIHGKEYIIRLRTVLNNYRATRHDREVQFNLVHFLLDKATELRDESVQNFPALSHKNTKEICHVHSISYSAEQSARYKYITFTRNGSSFITECDAAHIIESKDALIEQCSAKNVYIIFREKKIPVIDLFSAQDRLNAPPHYYIIVKWHKHIKCFAADRTGKRIYAGNDFVKTKTRPLSEANRIARGFLRIHGCSHIVLSWERVHPDYARK